MAFKVQVTCLFYPQGVAMNHHQALGSFSHTTCYLLGLAHRHDQAGKELNKRGQGCVNSPHQTPLGLEV